MPEATNPESDSLVSCPNCQAQQEVAPVNVIPAGDTELVQALFEGRLNKFSCSACDTQFMLDVPVLYRDDQQHLLIYYMPAANKKSWVEAEQNMHKLSDSIFAEAGDVDEPESRLTLSIPQFVEKIAVFRLGIDDRLLEYIKFQLYSQTQGKVDPVRNELFYDFSSENSDRLGFIIFDRETTEPVAGTHLPRDVYDELVESFASDPDLQEELDKLFPGVYVSAERLI